MTGTHPSEDAVVATRDSASGCYVVAHEAGHAQPDLPTWASERSGLITFERDPPPVVQKGVRGAPGVFQLLNVLTQSECRRFVELTELLGYHADAPVSLPHEVRHMCNVNWVVDESVDGPIWERCRAAVAALVSGPAPVGLNARFRCYRYVAGDYFKPHTDGAWPGSRVVGGRLVADAYGDRWSRMTFLLLLSDGYEGGRTVFHVPREGATPEEVAVRTPLGAALCFPHGPHPLQYLHAGEPVIAGRKYMIRTDILFALPSQPA